jgi:prepilin-type processing-associated H-X9-DG protein
MAQVQAPADTVIIGDAAGCDARVATDFVVENWVNYQNRVTDWQFTPPRSSNDGATTWFTSTGDNETRRLVPRHSGMGNVGYLDGHVKAEKLDRLFGPMPAGGTGTADYFDVN